MVAKKVTCLVFLGKTYRIRTVSNSVPTVVLPKIQLISELMSDKNNMITVIAGEESMLTCTVAGARPKPTVLWKIGNQIVHW